MRPEKGISNSTNSAGHWKDNLALCLAWKHSRSLSQTTLAAESENPRASGRGEGRPRSLKAIRRRSLETRPPPHAQYMIDGLCPREVHMAMK